MFYETVANGRVVLHAMPLLLAALCTLAIAYRFYSAFLAAKVAALDDSRKTPAYIHNDGQNYYPTNKWVLFGHHFAAISGAGPLIGPVLAIQYGYFPGFLWLLIGVCLAGAVQDMLVLAASVRRDGKSLAEIARAELGKYAAILVSAAILFIVIIALAGLGFVVVKALGGEEVKLSEGMQIILPSGHTLAEPRLEANRAIYSVPQGCQVRYHPGSAPVDRPEGFQIRLPAGVAIKPDSDGVLTLPAGSEQLIPGSSWGAFTIACTIPIALFVGFYMYRLRKGKVAEASLIGAVAVLAATVAGNWVAHSTFADLFTLNKTQTIWALTGYGFVASVLPVWMLLCPRDYLSSYLKLGTIALLVGGVLIANPVLPCPPVNDVFLNGGPTFQGSIFPFVFICIMCGSISGFHALVSSGTTPKMISRESDVRMIGYGAMLMEGLVGIVALIAAASLEPQLYYDINIGLDKTARWQRDVDQLTKKLGTVDGLEHLTLAQVEDQVGGESLRGRTGGAVTLAIGMAHILTRPLSELGLPANDLMKYWYHFAIMFEALFILTTIDTGTRIARFLLQESMGVLHPRLAQTDWLPGAVFSTLVVTAGWGLLVANNSIDTIWPMFGIANQLLAVIALCLVTTLLIQSGRGRYAWATLLPMLFVVATTMTAAAKSVQLWMSQMRDGVMPGLKGTLNIGFTCFIVACVASLLLLAVGRWFAAHSRAT